MAVIVREMQRAARRRMMAQTAMARVFI